MRPSFVLWLALCCLLLNGADSRAQPANAQPTQAPTGMVKRIAGTVTLERAGTTGPLSVGQFVRAGDTLRTGADGAVGVTLADDTLVTLGVNSELVLSAYSFDSTTQDGNVLVSLWRGTAAIVTGLIGKKAPEKVQVQTRTMVLGVRGTEFIVDAQPGKP